MARFMIRDIEEVNYNSLSKDELIQIIEEKNQKIKVLNSNLKDVKYDSDKKIQSLEDDAFHNKLWDRNIWQ